MERQRAAHDPAMAASLHALGVAKRLAGDSVGALRVQQEALASITAGPRAERDRMAVHAEIGIGQLELGDHPRALASLKQALALSRRLHRQMTPLRADALVGVGRARMGLGRTAEAVPPLEEADAFWRDFDAGNRWAGEAALWLGRCYAALGRSGKAEAVLARAHAILSRSPIPIDSRLARLARER
jgi:tetratricopeptide (TPR) repeat protein